VVEDLLHSFVHEKFVQELDFKSLKKLNVKFVPVSDQSRRADVVYEIKSHGQSAYIYLFLEFQSSVDRFMSMRMARYMFEFYQEVQRLTKAECLKPGFPILIYNGDRKWTAPTNFRDLLYPSAIPDRYLPRFTYFKIAINEIPKRELVRIRNAVAAVFYVENSTPEDIAKSRKELVSLLSAVLKNEGAELVQAIVERINRTQKTSRKSSTIRTISDLTEVSSMWETAVKKHDRKVFEQGSSEAKMESARKLIKKGMDNAFIRDVTGLSVAAIQSLRKKK
jgi:predicted transposase/invertase (TIGR01784 family)